MAGLGDLSGAIRWRLWWHGGSEYGPESWRRSRLAQARSPQRTQVRAAGLHPRPDPRRPDRAPADARRLRDEPVPDRAGQGRPDPIRRAQQLPGPVAAGRRGPRGDPANLVLRGDVDGHHAAARLGDRPRPQSRLPGRVGLLHGPAAALGGRVDRGRHLLACHLRHEPRDRERRARRLRDPRRAVQLAGQHGPDRRHRARRAVVAVGAAPRGPAAGRPQDHPAGALSGGQDGRRDLMGELPLHHPPGDQEHADRRRRPAGHHRAPGLRPAVQPDQRRSGPRHLRPDHGDLRHHVRTDQPGLWRGDHGHPVPDHRRGELPDPDRAGPAAARRSPSSTTKPRTPRRPDARRSGSTRDRRWRSGRARRRRARKAGGG